MTFHQTSVWFLLLLLLLPALWWVWSRRAARGGVRFTSLATTGINK